MFIQNTIYNNRMQQYSNIAVPCARSTQPQLVPQMKAHCRHNNTSPQIRYTTI